MPLRMWELALDLESTVDSALKTPTSEAGMAMGDEIFRGAAAHPPLAEEILA